MLKQFVGLSIYLIQTAIVHTQVLQGIVRDATDKNPVPYVNVSIPGALIGTVSKYDGKFSLDISSKNSGEDSLLFSIIGYKQKKIKIPTKTDSLNILLIPESVTLESVIVSPREPKEYIQMAINNIPGNYIAEPFNAIIYFKTMIRLNGKFIESSEALIQGYIMPVIGKYEDTTRLKLLALKYFDEEEQAIGTIVSKKRKKKGNKMAIEGLDSVMINLSKELSENIGIYTQIDSNLIKQLSIKGYPDTKSKYWFENMVRFEDRNLMKIGFSGNIKGMAKQRGEILFEENSLAFEAFNVQVESASLRIKALALLFGIGFKGFDAVLRFKSIPTKNGWIPDFVSANVFVDMEKNKWFAKDIPIIIEASSYMRFLKVEVPAVDRCTDGRIIAKNKPLIEQFKPDPGNPIWREYSSIISEKR